MARATLEVELRSELGTNKVKKIKSKGFIPAIVYGSKSDPIPVSVELRALKMLYDRNPRKRNTLIDLKVKGAKEETIPVISYKHDDHPVSREMIHIDFLRLEDGKKVIVDVPCVLVGTSKGQKMAGILIHNLKVVRLQCLPDEIPAEFEVDITEKEIGESIRASDIPVTGSIEILNDPNDVVMQIDAPRVVETFASEEAVAGASEDGEETSDEGGSEDTGASDEGASSEE